MAKLKFIVVGRTKAPFIREGERFYLERIRHYIGTEWIQLKPIPITRGRAEEEILKKEAEQIKRQVRENDLVIVLDARGRFLDSMGFSRQLERWTMSGKPLSFVMGGPLGLHQSLLDQADEKLALSPMTLTHEMARLVLLEQIYRAFTIMKGEKYHK